MRLPRLHPVQSLREFGRCVGVAFAAARDNHRVIAREVLMTGSFLLLGFLASLVIDVLTTDGDHAVAIAMIIGILNFFTWGGLAFTVTRLRARRRSRTVS